MQERAGTVATNVEDENPEDLAKRNQQNAVITVDQTATAVPTSVIVKTYDSDSENEKPILLELGSSANATTNSAHDLSIAAPYPPTEYPLDMHLNAYGVTAHYSLAATEASSATYTTLYSNPYLDTMSSSNLSLPAGGLPSLSSSLLSSVSYTGHIPQTVYSWSTPAQVPNAIDMANEPPTEMVAAPIYLGYTEEPEHLITKEYNPSWKEKVMQSEKDYKKTACDRERTRMRDMNRAFDMLRSKLPISKPNGKKYSKIESLRIAINYINHLQQCLTDADPLSPDGISTAANMHQNAVDYLRELSMRRRSQAYRYESRKSRASSYDDTNDKDSIDEQQQHHAWTDSYIGNSTSKDKWD